MMPPLFSLLFFGLLTLVCGVELTDIDLGREYLARRRYDAAYAAFHRVLARTPSNAAARRGLADALSGTSRLAEAQGAPGVRDAPVELVAAPSAGGRAADPARPGGRVPAGAGGGDLGGLHAR
jgi:hypothetical protein